MTGMNPKTIEMFMNVWANSIAAAPAHMIFPEPSALFESTVILMTMKNSSRVITAQSAKPPVCAA